MVILEIESNYISELISDYSNIHIIHYQCIYIITCVRKLKEFKIIYIYILI